MFMGMDEMRVCDRCYEQRGEKDMNGNLCGWCTEDLSRVDVQTQEEVARFRGHLNRDPGQPSLSDAEFAILWHARMAQDEGML